MSSENVAEKEYRNALVFSRIDFVGPGFRRGLLEQAKYIGKQNDANIAILAGGLVDARYHKKAVGVLKNKIREVNRKIKGFNKDAKENLKTRKGDLTIRKCIIDEINIWTKKRERLEKDLDNSSELSKKEKDALNREIREINKKIKDLYKKGKEDIKIRKESLLVRKDIRENIETLETKKEKYERRLADLSPEKIAKELADLIPKFEDGHGNPIKLYVFPSPAFDGEIGESVAKLISEIRKDDIRVYQSGGDTMPIKHINKTIGVLVPEKAVWMRGKYVSTAPERVIADKINQSSQPLPDLFVVGCFGSSISKPIGEFKLPYISVPALSRIIEVRTNENQIGVRILRVYKNHTNPSVFDFSLKDMVMKERANIGLPKGLSENAESVVESIRRKGRQATSILAEDAGISIKETIEAIEEIRARRRTKKWPGIIHLSSSDQWDFDYIWMRKNLHYPSLKENNSKTDSIVAYGCPHTGSVNLTYEFFLDRLPEVIISQNATVLVGAGDFVEGINHNLMLRGEVFGGLNVTQQEILAGKMIAEVTLKVFRHRFENEMNQFSGIKINNEEILAIVDRALITNVVIPGNHDLWSLDAGHTPLVVMKETAIKKISKEILSAFRQKGFYSQEISELVESKMIEPKDGKFTLPSGLGATVVHPHMSRTLTTSIRPQQILEFASDSHVTIGANFHVGEQIELWGPEKGQRVCMVLGTLKTRSDFEDHKLKIVDHGFGYLRIISTDRRIVATKGTFYSFEEEPEPELNQDKVLEEIFKRLNIN